MDKSATMTTSSPSTSSADSTPRTTNENYKHPQSSNGDPVAAAPGRSRRRQEPDALSGNFILMPSLLDYLTPDLTLPEQYFALQMNDDGLGAEKALMYAVLKDGIRCFYKHVGAIRRKFRKMSDEAEQWLMEDCWEYPFSFRFICDTLGIDGKCLREELLRWKDRELARREETGDASSVQVGRSPFPRMPEGDSSVAWEMQQYSTQETSGEVSATSGDDFELPSLDLVSLEELTGSDCVRTPVSTTAVS